MIWNSRILLIVPTALVFVLGFAVGKQAQQTAIAKSPVVGIYIEGIARQINIKDLQVRYPGETAQRVDPVSMKADAIVGWYDKGNSYHEQKMANNISKVFGAERIFPEALRGVALRGVTPQVMQQH